MHRLGDAVDFGVRITIEIVEEGNEAAGGVESLLSRKLDATEDSPIGGLITSANASITPRMLTRRATFNARQAQLCS